MTQKPSGNADTLLQAASRVGTLCVLASASLFDSLVFSSVLELHLFALQQCRNEMAHV